MVDSNKDLLAKAQEYSTNNVDLYELLQIEASAKDEKEIQRAWRKQSLKYHPDKTKDAFDPEKWELIENARDILLDTAARAAYDNARKAALLRKAERQRVEGARKRVIDELEAAEQEAKRQRLDKEEREREMEREKARLRAEGQRRMAEEAERFKKEQLERMEREREREPDEYDEKLAELQRQLDEKRRLKAEKKARKKGKADGAPTPDPAPAPAPAPTAPRAPPKWEDLKARMLEAQRRKEAMKAAEATNTPPGTETSTKTAEGEAATA